MAGENKSMRTVLESIREAAQDIASLDVVTLTGNITIKSSVETEDVGGTQKKKISLKKLYETIEEEAAKPEISLDVVAYTHIDFDKDAVNYVKQAPSENELSLVRAHNEMVKTSQEGRLALVKAVKELVGIGTAS